LNYSVSLLAHLLARVVSDGDVTYDRDKYSKVHHARHATATRRETDDETDSNHSHEEQDEWRPLLAAIGEPRCADCDDGCRDVDGNLHIHVSEAIIKKKKKDDLQ
jgi:hypothetical protein